MNSKRCLGLCSLVLVATTGGCNNGPGQLRVVNASADVQTIDVVLKRTDGRNQQETTHLFGGVQYTSTSPYQQEGDDGDYVVEVHHAGDSAGARLAVSQPFHLDHEQNYTAVVAGLMSPPQSDIAASLQVVVIKEQLLTSAGAASVVLMNASADTQSLAMSLPAASVQLTRFVPTAETLVASQPLQIGVSSTTAPLPLDTAFTSAALPAGSEVFLIPVGLSALHPSVDTALDLLVIDASGTIAVIRQNPFVYSTLASPDAPPLDLFAGGTEVAGNLAFGQLAPSFHVPPGDLTLDAFPHSSSTTRPTTNPIASLQLPALRAGQIYLEVASGFVTAGQTPGFQGTPYVDGCTMPVSSPKLRVIQAANVSTTVTMGTIGSGPFVPIVDFQNLSFLQSTPLEGTTVPAKFTLGVAPAGTNEAMAEFSVQLRNDQCAIGVTAGTSQPAAGQHGLSLILIDATSRPWTSTLVPNTKQ